MKTGKNILMGIARTSALFVSAQEPVDYVNPFVGTTNYGTTNPGVRKKSIPFCLTNIHEEAIGTFHQFFLLAM